MPEYGDSQQHGQTMSLPAGIQTLSGPREGKSSMLWTAYGAQWTPEVLCTAWKTSRCISPSCQQPLPSCKCQTPTFFHLKASIRHAKVEVQQQGEIAALQSGTMYNSQWGPAELVSVLWTAWGYQVQRNIDTQFILAGTIQNQLFIWRQKRWFNN